MQQLHNITKKVPRLLGVAFVMAVLAGVFASNAQAAFAYTTVYTPNADANATLSICKDLNTNNAAILRVKYVGNDSPFIKLKTVFGPNAAASYTQSLKKYQPNWTWEGSYVIPTGSTTVKQTLTFDDNTTDSVQTKLLDVVACVVTDTSTGGGSDTTTPPAPTNPSTAVKPVTPGTAWDWILSGTPTTTHLDQSTNPKKLIDIDLENNSAETIAGFKQKGIQTICYFSAGSYENWRSDARKFPASVLGKTNGWPGERWLDIRDSSVLDIMKARMDVAVSKGCDGVEPDNVDGYTNATGFPLTAADQIKFNKALATEAHARNLSIALKNDVDQVAELAPSFDFAVNEQCNQYSECGVYTAFTGANKAVLNAEYKSSAMKCSAMNAANIDSVLFALNLDNSVYQSCR